MRTVGCEVPCRGAVWWGRFCMPTAACDCPQSSRLHHSSIDLHARTALNPCDSSVPSFPLLSALVRHPVAEHICASHLVMVVCMSKGNNEEDIRCCAPTHCCKRQPPKSSRHSNSLRSAQASRVDVFARAGLSRLPVGPLGPPCLSLSFPTSHLLAPLFTRGILKKGAMLLGVLCASWQIVPAPP